MRKYHQRLSEIMDKQEIEDLADLPSIEEAEEEAKKWALTTIDDVDA